MKFQLFAVLLVAAGSFALPRANEVFEPSSGRNWVENSIRRLVEGASQLIKNAGLDPFELERRDFEINLGVLDFVFKSFVENVRFHGASDIRINQLDYNIIFNRLRLDISLPEVSLSVGDSGLEAVIAGVEIGSQMKGSLSIESIRVAGVGHVDISIAGSISLRSVSLDCSIGAIKSDVSVVAQGKDHSEFINDLLNNRIPFFVEDNKEDINGILEVLVREILKRIWGSTV